MAKVIELHSKTKEMYIEESKLEEQKKLGENSLTQTAIPDNSERPIKHLIKTAPASSVLEKRVEALLKKIQRREIPIITYADLDWLADKVRKLCGGYDGKLSVPVVSIAENLGLKVYQADMDDKTPGCIFAGGTTADMYGNNQVIFVSNVCPLQHQRFIVAHEIAHFLLNYLPDEKYSDKNLLYVEYYGETPHNTESELIADYFAAELLMPKKLFVKIYNQALELSQDRDVLVLCLSKYFKVKPSSIRRRMKEVL